MRIVYYDSETTDLRPLTGPSGIQMVQIGAICKHNRIRSQSIFDKYLLPTQTCSISPGATQVHGITHQWLLERYYQNIDVVTQRHGLQAFMDFLTELRDYYDEEIVLVAHNNFSFDGKVLGNNIDKFQTEFPTDLMMFDSIRLMREVRDVGHGLQRFNLESCLNFFFDEAQSQPHDAYIDADDCRRISEEASKTLGYGSLRHFLDENRDLLKSFDQFY